MLEKSLLYKDSLRSSTALVVPLATTKGGISLDNSTRECFYVNHEITSFICLTFSSNELYSALKISFK